MPDVPFQFISLQESGQRDPEGAGDQAIAQLWLQHSLQCHCLSAQLRPLLGNRQYIRKFYTGKEQWAFSFLLGKYLAGGISKLCESEGGQQKSWFACEQPVCQTVWVRGTPLSSTFFCPDTAFLLSDAHVTAMLQCLEAVEQNNPRLLAQIDTSMVS